MSIILAGGGNKTQSMLVDWWFRRAILSPSHNGAHVAYVPHAIAPRTWDWDRAEKWLTERDAMRDIKVQTVTDLSKEVSILQNATGIFLTGGNTFRLLSEFQRNRTFDTLKPMLNTKLVYGCSAGAIIMGHSIRSAALGSEKDENDVGLQELSGMDVLNGMNVFPHFTSRDTEAAQDLVRSEKRACICISEEGGCCWEHVRLTNIGSGDVKIIIPGGNILSLPERGKLQVMRDN